MPTKCSVRPVQGASASALVVFAVTYTGLAIAASAWLVATLFVLYGIHQGAFRAVGKALAVDLVPRPLRASGVGLYGATVGLSALLASVVGGQLWDRLGPAATFAYGAACALLGAAVLVAAVPSRMDDRRHER